MFVSDDEAQAAKAIAETTGKAIGALSGVGQFIRETLGTIPEDLIGLAGGDWVHEQRRRNKAHVVGKAQGRLEGVEPQRISEPSVSVVVPLLQAAANEGREELQDLWAALLANAMLDGGRRTRRKFFEVVRQMDVGDALVLTLFDGRQSGLARKNWQLEAEDLGMVLSEYRLAVETLEKLGCLRTDRRGEGEITPLGEELLAAVQPPVPAKSPIP